MASPEDVYDYVVVGGGTAGAVVAARLSEDPSVTVCLLEAGPSDVGDPAIQRLRDWPLLLESAYDWDYPIEPQVRGNGFLRHARARVLGGCSSHNSCIAFWALAEDLDAWVTAGASGWGAAECFPVFKRLERNDAPGDHHGRSGPVGIMTIPPEDPAGVALLKAAARAGIPTASFNTGATVVNGAGWFQINATSDNLRQSSSAAYLHPILGRRQNLDVRCDARALRLDLDASRRCTGVEYVHSNRQSGRVRARREVILSCGAIDTPKLLLLSGIGPSEHLRSVGVHVLVDSPGVGENLQDHVEGVVNWDAKQPMRKASTQWWEIGIFTCTQAGLLRPDLMFHFGAVPFDMNTVRHGYPTTNDGFCLTPNVTQARSTGHVRLRTRDFRDRPVIDPRYFTDPHDERVMLAGLRLARKIVAQPEMAEWAGRELSPGPDAVSDDELLDYMHKTHNTVYHPASSCAMGAPEDAARPLDPRLRVKGVRGLRVADASVMPSLTTVNPCITTLMIGERCADFIREDAQ